MSEVVLGFHMVQIPRSVLDVLKLLRKGNVFWREDNLECLVLFMGNESVLGTKHLIPFSFRERYHPTPQRIECKQLIPFPPKAQK